MARHEIHTCASPDWSCSGISGDGIPLGMVRASYTRNTPAFRALFERPFALRTHGRSVYRRGELDGKLYPSEYGAMTAKGREALLYGYTVRYYHRARYDRAYQIAWFLTRQARREASRHGRNESWYQAGCWEHKFKAKLADMGLDDLVSAIED